MKKQITVGIFIVVLITIFFLANTAFTADDGSGGGKSGGGEKESSQSSNQTKDRQMDGVMNEFTGSSKNALFSGPGDGGDDGGESGSGGENHFLGAQSNATADSLIKRDIERAMSFIGKGR